MNAIATLAIAKERWKRMWDLHSFKYSPLKGTNVEELGEEKEWLIDGRLVRFLTQAPGCSCLQTLVHSKKKSRVSGYSGPLVHVISDYNASCDSDTILTYNLKLRLILDISSI